MNQGCWGLFAVYHMRKCEVGKSGPHVTICTVLQQWTNETCQESLAVYLIAECQTDVLRLTGTYCGVPFVQESGGCTPLTGYILGVPRLPGTFCDLPFVQESDGCTTLTGYFLWSTV